MTYDKYYICKLQFVNAKLDNMTCKLHGYSTRNIAHMSGFS